MKSSKLIHPKQQSIKEVTLIIDSKILQQQPSPSIIKPNFDKTLRRPLSTITTTMMNLTKPKDSILKTPTSTTSTTTLNLNLNSTIKRHPYHSKSKSEDKKSRSALQRSHSLTSIHNTPSHTKNISFVSKQSNMKCFQKLVFKITDFFEREKYTWRLDKLSYDIVLKVMCELRYIQYLNEREMVDNNLIEVLKKGYQFWVNLSQDKVFTSLKNLIQMVCIIQNIIVHSDYVESALNSFRNHLQRRRGKLTDVPEYVSEYRFLGLPIFTEWNREGDVKISKNSIWKIQQCFNLFKTNRLNYNEKDVTERQVEKFSMSQKSTQLALNKRQKIQAIIKNRQPNIQKITLQDILNFKQDNALITPLSARTYDQSKSSQSKPATARRHRLKIHRKCQPLIDMLSQPKMIKVFTNEQLQFERNKKQCTFKPDINPLKVNQTQSLLKIKNVVKTLERMKNTRESKIQDIQFKETGWTNSRRSRSKDNKQDPPLSARRYEKENDGDNRRQRDMFKRQQKQVVVETSDRQLQLIAERTEIQLQNKTQQKSDSNNKDSKTDIKIPLLFIDINIDETQKQRLVIYQEDNSLELAANFAKKHNLSKQMESKLKELLDYQMNSILTKIEEEADEEQDLF